MIKQHQDMRIQKRLVRRDKDGESFYKFMINLPPDVLSEMKWKEWADLDYIISEKKLILQKK